MQLGSMKVLNGRLLKTQILMSLMQQVQETAQALGKFFQMIIIQIGTQMKSDVL